MKTPLLLLIVLFVGQFLVAEAKKPNILWITCEDISPYLGCYGFESAVTPNLDRLASVGVRFTRAYANAPVCGVARSSLLAGMHAPTLGTQNMRARTQLPGTIPAYPNLFREAGYYCTNNVKTDYNSNLELQKAQIWDACSKDAHWKNRPDEMPFFAVFNITITHESQLKQSNIDGYVQRGEIPATPRIPLEEIELPPYHPDLPEIRNDWARLHDLITLMDTHVGMRLQELEDAGLADDTIVFFNSDHGGQLAQSKRYIYNVGTQVPLIVSIPDKWKHLSAGEPGDTFDAIAEFVDLPKTMLSLAGIEPPEIMQGRILFGPGEEAAHETAHLYRDRMAERFDFSRAVTDGQYYFIRNFMPHRPRGRDSTYGYSVQANWRVWREWYEGNPEAAGPIRSQFFKPKSVVEIFDTKVDPWHVKNLADKQSLEKVRSRLEADLDQWMVEIRDTGLISEALFGELAGPGKKYPTIYDYARSDSYPVERILEVAKKASAAVPSDLHYLIQILKDPHPVIRYWGGYGLFLIRDNAAGTQSALRDMVTNDPYAGNRLMVAQALGLCGDPETAFKAIMQEVRHAEDGYVMLFALNAFQYSHTDNRLSKEDWQSFRSRIPAKLSGEDLYGWDYSKRMINEAISLWPDRPKVD